MPYFLPDVSSRLGAALLLAGFWLLLSSCSLLFSSSEVREEGPPACLGAARRFALGDEVTPGRHEHIDYRQGTISFWVRPLAIDGGQSVSLLDLPGLRILATGNEGLLVEMRQGDDITIDEPIWQVGQDQFIAVRWDSQNPLSGSGSLEAHIEVRVGHSQHFFAKDAPFVLRDRTGDVMEVGDADSRMHVDQLVIYDRPLFVSDNTTIESDLDRMANGKGASAKLANGGFDVLLATASPTQGGCENFRAEAWTKPSSFAPDLRSGDTTDWFGDQTPISVTEQVFSGGGIQVTEASVEITLTLDRDSSYLVEALTHGNAGGIDVQGLETTAPITFIRGSSEASRAHPERLLMSFETGPTDFEVKLLLSAANGDGPAYFHSVEVYPNLLRGGSFEGQPVASDGPWSRDEPPDDGGIMTFNVEFAYAGEQSVCLDSDASPHVLLQEPEGMRDDNFYLFGGAFLWRDGKAPGATIGNGSLFATGAPYDQRDKAGIVVQERANIWQIGGAVGRRLLNFELNNNNDLIRYGTPGYSANDASSHCFDSAYALEAQSVSGLDFE